MIEEERKDNLVKAARLAGYNEVAAEQVANQFLSSDQVSKEQLDAVYAERNLCVALIARMAQMQGYPVLLRMNDEPGWHIVFITLPTGQVSWHFQDSELPLFQGYPVAWYNVGSEWDGHTTEEKYERVKKFIRGGW